MTTGRINQVAARGSSGGVGGRGGRDGRPEAAARAKRGFARVCYRIVRHQDRIRGSFPGGKGIASYRPIFLYIFSVGLSSTDDRSRAGGRGPVGFASDW